MTSFKSSRFFFYKWGQFKAKFWDFIEKLRDWQNVVLLHNFVVDVPHSCFIYLSLTCYYLFKGFLITCVVILKCYLSHIFSRLILSLKLRFLSLPSLIRTFWLIAGEPLPQYPFAPWSHIILLWAVLTALWGSMTDECLEQELRVRNEYLFISKDMYQKSTMNTYCVYWTHNSTIVTTCMLNTISFSVKKQIFSRNL